MIELNLSHVYSLWQDFFCGTKAKVTFNVKVKYKCHIYQNMVVSGAFVFNEHILLTLEFYNTW